MILNLQVPQSWSELTQEQLHYACFLLSSGHYEADQVKALAIIRWSKLQPKAFSPDGLQVSTEQGQQCVIRSEQLAGFLPLMDWLMAVPERPVRLEKVQGCEAFAADLQGLPFEHYLALENLYQGYIHTKNSRLLDEMTPMLYGKKIHLTATEAYNVFLWFASVKRMFAMRFPHFFVPSPVSSDEVDGATFDKLYRAMNLQIRALTKGDITKEKEILAMDTHRALVELNAQAEEYEDLKKQYNAK
jgi:hypothetical protein